MEWTKTIHTRHRCPSYASVSLFFMHFNIITPYSFPLPADESFEKLSISFVNESGSDADGITTDTYTEVCFSHCFPSRVDVRRADHALCSGVECSSSTVSARMSTWTAPPARCFPQKTWIQSARMFGCATSPFFLLRTVSFLLGVIGHCLSVDLPTTLIDSSSEMRLRHCTMHLRQAPDTVPLFPPLLLQVLIPQ